jgi:acetyl-CoA C-acetyltransferase
MKEVVIAGVGQIPDGEHWDVSLRELAWNAIEAAVQDFGWVTPQSIFGQMDTMVIVGNMLAPQLTHQAHVGTLVSDFAGLLGVEAVTVESAGASGGSALRMGMMAVASGQADAALVVGVEKFTDTIGPAVEAALATSTDSDYEAPHGLTPAVQAALLKRRYLSTYDLPADALACFPVLAHANGVGNPNAMFRKAIAIEAYKKAGMVSEPLNQFDVAPLADGAAAVILTSPDRAPAGFAQPLVRLAGSGAATDTLALHDRPDPLAFEAVRLSLRRACRQAEIEPGEVDLFELHDAYSIFAALTLEAAGFAPAGESWKMAREGRLDLKGSLPVNTMGGLKARGNTGGASGVYQVIEAALQIRGQAGPNQVPDARRALVQSMGGPASVVVTHVLERYEAD